MPRWLLPLAAFLSTLLAIAAIVVWAATIHRTWTVAFATKQGNALCLEADRGGISLGYLTHWPELAQLSPPFLLGHPGFSVGSIEFDHVYVAPSPPDNTSGNSITIHSSTVVIRSAHGIFGHLGYMDQQVSIPIGFTANTIQSHWIGVGFPLWLLIGLSSIPPALYVHALRCRGRQTRRMRANLCVNCGYALTGNTSGVCPECGVAVKPG